jgi:tight adherence protein C
MIAEPRVLLAAVLASVAAYSLARAVVPARRRLEPRLRPYAAVARARFGTTAAEPTSGATTLWGPMITVAANRLTRIFETGATSTSTVRLRQAGLEDLGVEGYRHRQLTYALAGFGSGLGFAALVKMRPVAAIAFAAACGFFAGTRWQAKVARLVARRRESMQAEITTVAQLLAVYLRTGDTPAGALDRFAARTSGAIPSELAAAANQIRSGTPAPQVLDLLATTTPEPGAARLYRVYGSAWSSGGDPEALLALADDLRASRREQLARQMAKRNTAMVLPLVMVIGPILILFVAAAIPSIVFGP